MSVTKIKYLKNFSRTSYIFGLNLRPSLVKSRLSTRYVLNSGIISLGCKFSILTNASDVLADVKIFFKAIGSI